MKRYFRSKGPGNTDSLLQTSTEYISSLLQSSKSLAVSQTTDLTKEYFKSYLLIMFSSLFGKRRSSPVKDEAPPIPGPKPDDGFVIVDPTSPRSNLYPNVNNIQRPQPLRPAPVAPVPKSNDQIFHYLQGVPFVMSRELQMSKNKETFATEIGDLLAFLTSKINMSSYGYDFSVESSVLKEC